MLVQGARADVVEHDQHDEQDGRSDPRRVEQIREVPAVERREQVIPGRQCHAGPRGCRWWAAEGRATSWQAPVGEARSMPCRTVYSARDAPVAARPPKSASRHRSGHCRIRADGGSPGCEPCCRSRTGRGSRTSRGTCAASTSTSWRPTARASTSPATASRSAASSDLTQVPPLVGGQVKTFHPAVYAGILARRDVPEQLAELEAQGIGLIDIVVVNVKPFAPGGRRPARRPRRGDRDDRRRRGGAPRRRGAQRRRRRRGRRSGPLPGDRRRAPEPAAHVSPELRARLAAEAFSTVAAYHAEIAAYLNQIAGNVFPSRLAIVLEKVDELRYGENPHQRAAFYRETTHRSGTLADAEPAPGRPAVVQQPARPRRRVSHRARLHGARPSRSSSTPTRSGWPRTRSSSRPTGTRSRPIRSRRSAASSA